MIEKMKMSERIRLWSNYSMNDAHRTDMLACADHMEAQAAEIDDIRKERDALRAAVLAIDSLRGPFMSDDDIAFVWKLVDAALSGEGK